MTLISDQRHFSKIDNLGRKWTRRILVLKCDQCENIFERMGPNISRIAIQSHHTCSNECKKLASSKLGYIRRKIENTCFKRYGSSSPLGSKECQKKSKITCLNKYGKTHPGSVSKFIEKRQNTCFKRYGHKSFLTTPECRKLLNSPDVQFRRQISISKIDWAVRARKSHETMKTNGSYLSSKIEERFYQTLCLEFGDYDIVRQATVCTWPIDFYIKSIDTYVQFDGVYWHGLDRPIETIMKHTTPRDVIIQKKYEIDRDQCLWFKLNDIRLIRITDAEFISEGNNVLKRLTNE